MQLQLGHFHLKFYLLWTSEDVVRYRRNFTTYIAFISII